MYESIHNYMLEMMGDSAHDPLHIYRVLQSSLAIADNYPQVNRDMLIAACLLHDIGRDAQFQDDTVCHAEEGGRLAYDFLTKLGWDEKLCGHVRDCITTHRFRTDMAPDTIEAKILFDADKLEAAGAIGIARSLIYSGQIGEPLYTVDDRGRVQDSGDTHLPESFLKEYHYKLEKVYAQFHTKEAYEIGQKRKLVFRQFYEALIDEIPENYLNINLE